MKLLLTKFLRMFGPHKRYFSKELDNLLGYLDDGKLLHCSGSLVTVEKALRNKTMLMYYFSASWCMPCKQLLPKIKDLYKVAKDKELGLEIVFISSDTEEDVFKEYFMKRHGSWYAVPFNDNGNEVLKQMYGVQHVPQVIVVRQNDGEIITRRGTKDISDMGNDALVSWTSAPP